MAKITFITRDNETIIVEGESGSVMQLAKQNGIKGIDGECGGVCSCATCHVHVQNGAFDKTGEQSVNEQDLLELNEHADENSRLCCQMQLHDGLDGLVLKVAEKSTF
ncbi:2Fe-2S iron-sulfur cluster-binding protein [Saccharicrinis fermentans]|uniref:Ferredoxin VI n=1 Tax=Saccharicrinis fermentans DSM 9555 = JCM 21142 TaxID=869213 RepID=W7YIU4_9BACT|nr:2Fe-2S iron-sulfur cluster-binding protein [Saccharicrinis fermentans]GAF02454.1 ferredoxin VI [Saccharicrinis fermentans DSM 9555 = JCM 21142]